MNTRAMGVLALVMMAGCGDQFGESNFFDPIHFNEAGPVEVAQVSSPAELRSCMPMEERDCAMRCSISVSSGESDCDFVNNLRTVDINMSEFERLTVRAVFNDPTGFSFHLGDSPSNNGHGGDGAQFSNDAELHTLDDNLLVYGNDSAVGSPDYVRKFPAMISQLDGVLEFTAGDGFLSVNVGGGECLVEESSDLLRLDAPDQEGRPDRLWYMGLGGVYSGGRSGTGLDRVELCFQ